MLKSDRSVCDMHATYWKIMGKVLEFYFLNSVRTLMNHLCQETLTNNGGYELWFGRFKLTIRPKIKRCLFDLGRPTGKQKILLPFFVHFFFLFFALEFFLFRPKNKNPIRNFNKTIAHGSRFSISLHRKNQYDNVKPTTAVSKMAALYDA